MSRAGAALSWLTAAPLSIERLWMMGDETGIALLAGLALIAGAALVQRAKASARRASARCDPGARAQSVRRSRAHVSGC